MSSRHGWRFPPRVHSLERVKGDECRSFRGVIVKQRLRGRVTLGDVIMKPDIDAAIRQVRQANIGRYRRLLGTPLTAHERQFIERRLAEEEEALGKAVGKELPFDLAAD